MQRCTVSRAVAYRNSHRHPTTVAQSNHYQDLAESNGHYNQDVATGHHYQDLAESNQDPHPPPVAQSNG
jgi:hypothetical protein